MTQAPPPNAYDQSRTKTNAPIFNFGGPTGTANAGTGQAAIPGNSNASNAGALVTAWQPGQDPLDMRQFVGKAYQSANIGTMVSQITRAANAHPGAAHLLRTLLYGSGYLTGMNDSQGVVQAALLKALDDASAGKQTLSTLLANNIAQLGRITQAPANPNSTVNNNWQLTGQSLPTSSTYVEITDPVQVAQAFNNVATNLTGSAMAPGQQAAFVNWFHQNQISAGASKEASKATAQSSASTGGLSQSLQNVMSTFANDPTMAAEYWIRTNDPIDYGKYQGMVGAQQLNQLVSSQGQRSLAPDVGLVNANA